MSEESGREILRQTLYSRIRAGALPMIARECGAGLAALDDFSRGETVIRRPKH